MLVPADTVGKNRHGPFPQSMRCRIMMPHRCPPYLTCQRDFADVNQLRIWKQKNYFGLFGSAQSNHRVSCKREARESKLLGWKQERCGRMSPRKKAVSKSWTRKGNSSLLEPQKDSQFQTLTVRTAK